MSQCPTCSRFLGDTDLPSVWIILHNGQVRGVLGDLVEAITRADAIARRSFKYSGPRSVLYRSANGEHEIKIERYIVT